MDSKSRLFPPAPGWPGLFDLKCGGTVTFERNGRAWTVKLISVRGEKAPDWRSGAFHGNKMFKEAKVLLEIDGSQCLLRFAPFMPPVSFQGLRLHVETVKALSSMDASSKDAMPYDARIAAAPESAPWTPLGFRFPVPGHLWRSNPCYGAWGALDCGDSSRYCDGFNIGVSEDAHLAVASLAGSVKSIVLQPDGLRLATITLEHVYGLCTVYGNIDASSIPYRVAEGRPVDIGEPLGKVSLENVPPHLRFGLAFDGVKISPYPALLEAYLRESHDGAVPCAGWNVFCHPGERLRLDAAAATALRPGRSVSSVAWLLSDGSGRKGSQVELCYKEPGFHSEELHVLLDDGQEFRDAVQVRVFKPGENGQTGFPGWLSHSPTGGVKPESDVRFRLALQEGFRIDSLAFGDGSNLANPPCETSHSYGKPGLYTVVACGVGPDGIPVTLKRFVRVRPS